MTIESSIHSLFTYKRTGAFHSTDVTIDPSRSGTPVQKYLLGNFIENLGPSFALGISAELLVNPTFTRNANLDQTQMDQLLNNGKALTRLYLSGGDPAALKPGWAYTPHATGFGVAVLDDATRQGLPLGWSPLGIPGAVTASTGRVGDALRLQGGQWAPDSEADWPVIEDGPAGIRQGVFLPVKRCLSYQGTVWVRISTLDEHAHGEIEVGLRRRIATPDGMNRSGECLISARISVMGGEWKATSFDLQLAEGQVSSGEPVDFYLRWVPRSQADLQLLLDRAELYPGDADEGLDPEVILLARDWPVPLLRWPGGNFVSYYHWRDGVGRADLRPSMPNPAWGGLDYNLIGTDELIVFCQKIGAEPHITVNSGTGTAEEAAGWVEYCNGGLNTPMGRLRAENGHPAPYNVRIWEVGNEVFGAWQGGYHGSDENARRFRLFAEAMRAASPIPLTLIACGNAFDFVTPGPKYDHVHADQRWHDQLLQQAPDQIDLISLHSLPVNKQMLENVSDEQAHQAILGQITTWERRFLPELLQHCDQSARSKERPPIQLAMTEWGPLGGHPNRLVVENFGAVVYAGAFLNMMIRNAERIPIANSTGFMHGGCIRKAYGLVFFDPQYLAMQQYQPFIGSTPLAVDLSGPGYDIDHPADLGAVDKDIPYIDVVACRPANGIGLLLAVVNKSRTESLPVNIQLPGTELPQQAQVNTLAYPDITAHTSPAQPDLFSVSQQVIPLQGDSLQLVQPPFSVSWIKVEEAHS